jgi:Domain of unknown function (DUF4249)
MFINPPTLFIILAAAACCLTSCQEVVSINLNQNSPNIVIDGVVQDHPGPYSVILSMTGDYFTPSLYFPPVSNALIIMSDDMGHRDTLKEVISGTYQTSTIQGVPGKSYQLSVVVQGKEYDATSSMPTKVFIDSLYDVPRSSFDGGKGYDIYVVFRDPPELGNYYRVNAKSSALIPADSIDGRRYRLYTDKLTNGNEMAVRIRAGRNVNPGDTITIDLLSIDKAAYDYFHTLANILTSDQSPTSLAPSNPTTNISGGALGYFAAYGVDSKQIIVR